MTKKKVVLVSIYLPGIYPSGDDTVVSRLLATTFLKATATADPEIAANYDIEISDVTTTTSNEKIAEQILDENPDVVAYSVYMWNYDQMAGSVPIIKKSRPDIKVILGGPLVTYTPDEYMQKNPDVDIIVCGEAGELRFKEILKSDFTTATLSQVKKIAYRDEAGQYVYTGGLVEEDVSQIPSIYKTGALDLNDGRRHTVFVETFRGCPFTCGYCIWGPEGSKLNKFDLDTLLQDIETIYNNPNVAAVIFTDACLFYTKKRAQAISNKIASCSRKIPTVLTLDVHVLDENMVTHLNKINLYQNQYHFGLQTTNPKALALLERPGGGGPDKYVHKIGLLRNLLPSAEISFDLIYGLPGDDYEHFRESVNFALHLKPSKIHFSPLLLLPGTRFYNERDKMGFVYDDEPPYMVRANQTFSEEDMCKATSLVLWTMAVLYFPATRDTIYKIVDHNPLLKEIDLIEEWVALVSSRVDPMREVKYEFTIEANNVARRTVMNTLTRPENCVHCYEAMLEILKIHKSEHLSEDIQLGIDFYKTLSHGTCSEKDQRAFENPDQFVDQGIFNVKDRGRLEHVKTVWVSSE
ncbi:cobalamin-dependent protein [Acidobacteria bacterium AH-259-D05]|nr:cobalamin-dependent protein [Acidobacteria bacterium AH-259-D05]